MGVITSPQSIIQCPHLPCTYITVAIEKINGVLQFVCCCAFLTPIPSTDEVSMLDHINTLVIINLLAESVHIQNYYSYLAL